MWRFAFFCSLSFSDCGIRVVMVVIFCAGCLPVRVDDFGVRLRLDIVEVLYTLLFAFQVFAVASAAVRGREGDSFSAVLASDCFEFADGADVHFSHFLFCIPSHLP